MDATNQPKRTAPSTPPVPPAASPAAESPAGATTGTDTFSKSVLLAELGLSPEGHFQAPEVPPADAGSAAADQAPAPVAEAEAAADEPAPQPEAAAAESESTEPAASSEPGEASGASEENPPAEPPEEEETKSPLQQRIDELTAGRKSAEEQAARLREQLAEAQARASGALEASPLAMIDNLPTLQMKRDQLVILHQWALENPDGGTMPGKEGGEPIAYSREEVARIQGQTFRLLNREVPQRAAYLQARAQADSVALQSYPWLKSVGTGYGAEVQQAIEQVPVLRSLPGYRLITANALIGEKLRAAGIRVDEALIARLRREQGAAAPAKPVPPKAPSAPARPGTVPPRTAPKASLQRSAARQLAANPGSQDALESAIAAKLSY